METGAARPTFEQPLAGAVPRETHELEPRHGRDGVSQPEGHAPGRDAHLDAVGVRRVFDARGARAEKTVHRLAELQAATEEKQGNSLVQTNSLVHRNAAAPARAASPPTPGPR